MANAIYPNFRKAVLSPGVNLLTSTVKAVLIDTGQYGYSDAHEFLSSVPTAARYGTAQALAAKTVAVAAVGGAQRAVFDANDSEFPTVAAGSGTGDKVEALLIYVEGSDDASSRLVAYIDTATGLPLTLNGSSARITWSADGIVIF